MGFYRCRLRDGRTILWQRRSFWRRFAYRIAPGTEVGTVL
jgi:hypothetical protein